jgi:diguanylate cyclase (GGDEF)-like protein
VFRFSCVDIMEVRGIGATWNRLSDAGSAPTRALRGVRQGATSFLILGAVGLSAFFIPGTNAFGQGRLLIVDLVTMLAGGCALSPLGRALTGYRSLLMPLLSLAIIACANSLGLLTPVPLGIYFVIIFVWIGQWHPPGTALRFAPIGVLAYLVPFAIGAPRADGELSSVVLVMAASVLIAEVLARQARAADQAQCDQAETLAASARASRTDDLTGLGNRRLGNQLLDQLTAGDFVAILDLDHFKQVNDTHGHARGDQLLQELGAFLRAEVRDADTVARMGGEEFMVVFRSAPDAGVAAVERLLTDWHERRPMATLSAGAAIHLERSSPSLTYAQADRALYQAKAAGRGRLVLAGAVPASGESAVAA